jgi:hypothetical protein
MVTSGDSRILAERVTVESSRDRSKWRQKETDLER